MHPAVICALSLNIGSCAYYVVSGCVDNRFLSLFRCVGVRRNKKNPLIHRVRKNMFKIGFARRSAFKNRLKIGFAKKVVFKNMFKICFAKTVVFKNRFKIKTTKIKNT